MDDEQRAEEIRELNDRTDRLELNLDQLDQGQRLLAERSIPAAVADVSHRLTGLMGLVVDLAGTAGKLAVQIDTINDRLTLLERALDPDLPPVADDL